MAVRQVLGAGATPLHGTVAAASRAGGRSGTSLEALAGRTEFWEAAGRARTYFGGNQASPSGPAPTRAQPIPSGDRGSLPPGVVDPVMM